jgi:GH24 family phage-related lysozyme (muramidase)
MRNITDVVDEAVDTVDRNVVQPVVTGVETAVDIVQEKAGKLKDKAVNNIISLYNNMKAYGAEILRDTPEFIEISQLANGQVIDGLVNSVTANKPINSHVGAVEQLIKDEDFSNVQYQDGKGKSIGYGFAIAALEDDERALIKDINNITEKEAKAIINIKVKKIADKFARDVKNFDTLSVTRQVALINFAYQLGYENVTNQGKDPGKQWPKFFSMLKVAANLPAGSEDRDDMFSKVRDNMLYNYSSKGKTYTDWFTQTPNRAKRVAQSIRGY